MWAAVLFALALATFELIQGTELYFVACIFVYIVIATLAFNTTGGFSRPSGAYIFFNAVLTTIVGVTYKAYLGEPGQSNLLSPRDTLMVYLLGMVGLLVTVYLSKRLAKREGWLENMLTLDSMYEATWGCLVVGIAMSLINRLGSGNENGSILSALNQLNKFLPMAILLGVTHQIRKTGGRSSLSTPVIIAMVWQFADGGILGFSKEAMFTPFFTWLLPCAALRYRFSWVHVAIIAGGAAFMNYYLVPYSQYGRTVLNQVTSFTDLRSRAFDMLTHLDDVRAAYFYEQDQSYIEFRVHYYDAPQGIWDRLQMIAVDDRLITVTEEEGRTVGYAPLIFGIENTVPHFLWKDKPTTIYGNVYAHEIGLLAPEDVTTGVSFSPAAEGWHMDRWVSLLLLAPVTWFFLFIVFDSLTGDARRSPWGLLPMVRFAHLAPEGGLNIIFYEMAYGTVAILFVCWFSAYVLPKLGVLVIGSRGQKMRALRAESSGRLGSAALS